MIKDHKYLTEWQHFHPEKVLLYAKQILNVCKAKVTLLSKECENELYVACNIFLSKWNEEVCKIWGEKMISCFAEYKWSILNTQNENKTEHNLKWSYITDHPYRILKKGGPGSAKRNALLNLINNQPDIDKIYLYAKETKHQILINKKESTGLQHFNDAKAFIEYSNDIQDV